MVGVRSYGNSLFIENLFKRVPNKDTALTRFSKKVLNPTVKVTLSDCNTVIGTKKAADDSLIGQISLATGKPITLDYLDDMFRQGIYDIRVRDTESCTARNGICKECLKGLYARLGATEKIPEVGSSVTLPGAPGAFLAYLASTYSGALLGILPIPSDSLPVNPTIMSDLVDHDEMDTMLNKLLVLGVTQDEVDYIRRIPDKFEKALMIVAYYGVYGNAST